MKSSNFQKRRIGKRVDDPVKRTLENNRFCTESKDGKNYNQMNILNILRIII